MMKPDTQPDQQAGDNLENAFPVDWGRRLRGEAGLRFLDATLAELAQTFPRERARRTLDEGNHRATVSGMLANLVAASFNRSDSCKYLAVPFNNQAYAGLEISLRSAVELRDCLHERGLIEYWSGYFGRDPWGNPRHSRNSRLRAMPAMRAALVEAGVGPHSITIADNWLLRMGKRPATDSIPNDVAASREMLRKVNQRLAEAQISLPSDRWDCIADRWRRGMEKQNSAVSSSLNYSGDESAVSLYRSFTDAFEKGGRFYGGWWINIPSEERLNITIGGEPVVECDYSQLHPVMLYSREGEKLRFDPYEVPGFGTANRKLAKATFQRLLNGEPDADLAPRVLRASADDDISRLPKGSTFRDFVAALIDHNRPIRHWFGKGQGVHLQREDSDLACGVLAAMKQVLAAKYDAFPLLKHKAKRSQPPNPSPPLPSITRTRKRPAPRKPGAWGEL
ncbi:hypothetical protein FJQ54_07255 [Sandaracinobacter neustonicus]|uniref:Uncharacterized protein n=1 Tax=Sandaracinobacter neustonicus TaxID=1715348 RepID=A0A501XNS2_9SPHN|nr:hypothetical protein [Sandaracinobacter neustonicus]TPE62312.1 hypothetical protein FJQ54_07255 [Sandaracinobacter neustonicus]